MDLFIKEISFEIKITKMKKLSHHEESILGKEIKQGGFFLVCIFFQMQNIIY